MNRPGTLKHLLLGALATFTLTTTLVVVGVVVLFGRLRRDVDAAATNRAAEHAASDEILMAVYGQIIASNRQLYEDSRSNLDRFTALGQTVHTRVRQYLFQEMSLDARLQVETIKELHQSMEVDAHQAFDLTARGETDAAGERMAALTDRAAALELAMREFVSIRTQEHDRTQAEATMVYTRALWVITLVVVTLIVGALCFVRMLRIRVLDPLAELAQGAARIGRGDLSTRIPRQRHDELDQVARSFNHMSAAIQETREEIEHRNVALTTAIRDLGAAQQELVQQEKLGAIGFMLAGLAHELNNPLAGILGTAQILESELSTHSDARIRALATEIAAPLVIESRRAGDLVKNLLQFSRKPGTRVVAINLKTALGVAAGLRSFAFTQAAKVLRIDVPDDLFVSLEEQRFEHVALNIMSNALDAMKTHGGTTLTVSAHRVGVDEVAVVFADDGPGFDAPDRVFDAFYSTKAVGEGTGLGLTLVHQFLSEAGGSIIASNPPEGGARLTVKLGLVDAPPTALTMAFASVATTDLVESGMGNDVLVVDDEPALREIQRRYLESIGCRVQVARDGAEAIALLTRLDFAAVISDVRMPGEIDGLALHAWLTAERPDLVHRCLFVTGDIGAWSNESVLPMEAANLLAKPFTRAEYLARVKLLLAGELVAH